MILAEIHVHDWIRFSFNYSLKSLTYIFCGSSNVPWNVFNLILPHLAERKDILASCMVILW